MGFLAANVTAIETIRLSGLTITHQFVDAPTKYHFRCVNVPVMYLPTMWAIHPTTKVRGLSCLSFRNRMAFKSSNQVPFILRL